ncbi:MAG: dTDP-4-dehydrorhamnose 3,5-epimerase [Planctomycetaceae bacterium]|nr:dTDP-4-dehydrorhamnose 3,5-epimerase [Planctomycetaceae bacterium]
MIFESTSVPEVLLVKPRIFGDDRGFFLETWSASAFEQAGLSVDFVQDNWSRSSRGVLRGLHFQKKHTQGKLVRCMTGTAFDVAVDVRRSSPTFGNWVGATLSGENRHALWIPPGFAHGFLALSDTVDFCYKCTDVYDPESEESILWDDPELGIDWPLEAGVKLQMSDKDTRTAKPLSESPCLA